MRSADAPTLADKLVEIHAWLRIELDQIRTEARAYFAAREAADDPPGLGLQLRRRCLEFCEGLEFHHTGEDRYIFPKVAAEHPELREAIERLGDEHRAIAALKAELAALLADIASVDPEAFTDRLERVTKELSAHLDYEEEQLIPALAEVTLPSG